VIDAFEKARQAAQALEIGGGGISIPSVGWGGGGGAPSGIDLPNPAAPTAHGGIFTRPTRRLIGEAGPEAVIPLSRLRDPNFLGDTAEGSERRTGGMTQIFEIHAEDVSGVLRSQQQIMARASLAALHASSRSS
jgi:hypothetical protein